MDTKKFFGQKNRIRINWKSDTVVAALLICAVLFCYFEFSVKSILIDLYILSLFWYIFLLFYVVKIRVFSGIGLYVIYLFCFVQSGILMQDVYFSFHNNVVYAILLYNFISPFLVMLFPYLNLLKRKELKQCFISEQWTMLLFLTGVVSIFIFFVWVGTIPLFADDAENFRVQALAGKGFLVIIAATCFKISILVTSDRFLRLVRTIFGVALLLGTGYRSQALEIVLVVFLTYWIGVGKKYIINGGLIVILLGGAYSLVGVVRSGMSWSWSGLYKPALWRLYVNTNNFNTIYELFPRSQFQYGRSFLNDLSVVLPGAQTTFMTQLKDIMGVYFDGGSLTPSVFGEGYYNWGMLGAILWPMVVLFVVMLIDIFNKKFVDSRGYYVISFALVGFSTTSFVPVLVNAYIPLILVYFTLAFFSKKYRLCM